MLHRFLISILKSIRKNRFSWLALAGIFLTLAAFLVSLHMDVFEQFDNPVQEIPRQIRQGMLGSEPVDLSLYLEGRSQKEASTGLNLQASTAAAPLPLYIFALDISDSVKGKVAKEELERYLELIEDKHGKAHAQNCLNSKPEEDDQTSISIAIAELCRLMDSIPTPAKVALWTFGNEPVQVIPPDQDQHGGPRFIEATEDKHGAHPMRDLFAWLEDPPYSALASDKTDIEALFENLLEKYSEELATYDQKVHLIIVSDFIHDIGLPRNRDREAAPTQTEWDSRYRTSRQVISEHVRNFARTGNMLHLMVIRGGSLSFRNILPVFQDQGLNWADVRETRVGEGGGVSAFDFLRSYHESTEPLVFRYTGDGIKRLPAQLRFDREAYEKSHLRIDLAADSMEGLPALKITVSPSRNGPTTAEHYPGTIWPGQGGYGRAMLRSGKDGDLLWLKPSMVLEPHHADRYRLLIAWQSFEGNNNHEPSERVTYSIPILFRKDLPTMSAYFIFTSFLLLLVTVVPLILHLSHLIVGLSRKVWKKHREQTWQALRSLWAQPKPSQRKKS